MRSPHRLVVTLVIAVAVMTGSAVTVAAPASAEPPRETWLDNTDYLRDTRTSKMTVDGTRYCVITTYSSTLRYRALIQRQPGMAGNPDIYRGWLVNVRQEQPRAVVTFYDSNCRHRMTVDKVVMTQAHRAYSCTYNPQLSVGFPWTVGVGFWPTCGSVTRAAASTTFDQRSSRFDQLYSSASIRYGNQFVWESRGAPPANPRQPSECYGASLGIDVIRRSSSNRIEVDRARFCPSVFWPGAPLTPFSVELDRYYSEGLGRPIDAEGRAYWLGVVRTPCTLKGARDTGWGILAASDEMVTNLKVQSWELQGGQWENRAIRRVFRALLGRDPEPGAYTYWSAQMNNWNPRDISKVVHGVIFSVEYENRVRSLGCR